MTVGHGGRLGVGAAPGSQTAERHGDLARRAEELDAIYRLTDAVARAETIDTVFGAALDALRSALGVERASVVFFDADGSIHFGAWRGLSDEYRGRIEGESPWKGRSADPSAFVVDDVFSDRDVEDLHDAFRDEGIASMALVPLVHAGTVLGRFVLYADRPGAFRAEDVQLAETMASHVAAAAHRRRTEAAVRESRNQLAAIFRSVADGITAQAPDGSIVYANEAAARFSGFDSLEEFMATPVAEIAARFDILDEHHEPLPVEELPGRVALAEGRECERLVQYVLRPSGERRWSLVRATPVFGEDARVTLAINVFHDLTRERRAGDRLQVLADAGRALSSSLAVDDTLTATARLLVPAVADYCLVDLLEDDGSLRHVAHVHVDPEGERTLEQLRRRYPVLGNPAHPVARVVATREPHFQSDSPDEALDDIALDDDHRELYRRLAPSSFLAVPLVARGRTLGAISLGTSAGSGRRLGADDLKLALELAERAALAVDNALLYQEAQAEVTERQRTAERLRTLARAGEVLAGSLDYEETLQRLARFVVPSFADWCVVYECRDDGSIRRLAIEHAGGQAERVRAVLDRFPLDPDADHGVPAVVRTGVPELVEDESAVRLTRDVADPAGLMEELADISPRSSIRVPLIARGRTLGAIALLAAESGRTYGPDDLAFASELARRAALAVDNARLFHAQRRARAEADARAQAAQALEFVGDGVFLVDAEGIVRLWNRAAEAITGVGHEAVVGQSLTTVVPGWAPVAERVPVASTSTMTTTRPETLPFEIDGRERWLSISGVAFPRGTVYAFRDLTEEYAVERLKTDFVSTVSHELRTPLAAIYGAAMTLQRTDVSLGEDQRTGLLAVVAGESERLARIVNDVLWASRLDAGVLDVAIESCDAGALATAVVAAARAHLPPAVELSLHVTEGTPPVAADPDKVRQVLVNLLDNAVKYSPDGGLIEVRVERAERGVGFRISDRGLGIPAAEHGRIFEKFFRLDPNLTRGVGGTGLGLYICRELVRRMEGRIGVNSVEGAGSTFWFELPMAG